MNDDHIKSEIPSYLTGELPESRNRQIEAHAAGCEKCRNALSKARAKVARGKREALKKASSERSPNLFLARQGKLAGADISMSWKPWIFAALFVAAGGGYWAHQKKHAVNSEPAPVPLSEPAPVAQAPVPPAPVPAPVVSQKAKPAVVMHVFQDWKGPESAIKESRLVVIRNADAWNKLWTEMQTSDPLPEVDFDQKLVLGVFAGEQPAGTSVQLGRIEEDEDVMLAPYRFNMATAVPISSTAPTIPSAAGPNSHPYLLAMVPRVDKKIRLTQKEKSQ